MIAQVTNHISEGLLNSADSAYMTWFMTNFNMPVPWLYTFDPALFSTTDGMFGYVGESNSYDLSGFDPGFEICVATAVFYYENNTAGTLNLDSYEYIRFTNPDTSSFNPVSETLVRVTQTLPSGYWSTSMLSRNVGVAGWEINTNDTYHFISNAIGMNGDTPNISTVVSDIAITNCPSTSKLSSTAIGNIWVEGNALAYVNCGGSSALDGGWKHKIYGTSIGSDPGTDKVGVIWIEGNDIHWVGADGDEYTPTWSVKQKASFFSGGPTTKSGLFTASTDDTITSSNHTLSNNDIVQFVPLYPSVLPAGLSTITQYYVVSATTSTFKVSLTFGGSPVDITGTGTPGGYFFWYSGSKYAGTDKAGCIWMDQQFGQTHLAYIGADGYKYLTGSGVDPY